MLLVPFYIGEDWGNEDLSGCQDCTAGESYNQDLNRASLALNHAIPPAPIHSFIVTS